MRRARTRPWLRFVLLALVALAAACRDPSPTFVFDAGGAGGSRDGAAGGASGDAQAERPPGAADGGGQ